MRIFLAGGSGVIGTTLIPLLTAAGHRVTAMTRSPAKTSMIAGLGAAPVVADVLDAAAVRSALRLAAPDVVVHQLTDLAAGDSGSNARLRISGTRHLVAAAREAGVRRMIAQSISWVCPPGESLADETEPLDPAAAPARRTTIEGVRALEAAVQELDEGVVLRYGQFYGPGTWYARDGRVGRQARRGELPATETVVSFVHVTDAARAAVSALSWPRGIWNIVDDQPAPGREWAPIFARAVGGPPPPPTESGDIGRPVSNARSRARGFSYEHPTWRDGFVQGAPRVGPAEHRSACSMNTTSPSFRQPGTS
jgi:nucleoside-diphosphate-sugar epimerase